MIKEIFFFLLAEVKFPKDSQLKELNFHKRYKARLRKHPFSFFNFIRKHLDSVSTNVNTNLRQRNRNFLTLSIISQYTLVKFVLLRYFIGDNY